MVHQWAASKHSFRSWKPVPVVISYCCHGAETEEELLRADTEQGSAAVHFWSSKSTRHRSKWAAEGKNLRHYLREFD